ncbi:hypothetical protein AB6A40_001117 [Gnathostoma spinigerum]|uniref:Pentatricopeptide repeat-containing protein n=1 Tax=Gnathostoma spinigerum TaxID=75299 RepID=A0ABD6E3F7_9BILA
MTALYHLKTLRLFQRTCPRYMNSVAYLSVQPNQAHVLPSSELRSSEKVHGRNPPLQPYKNKRLMMSPIRKQIGRYKQKGIDSEEEELIERHREGLENLNWLTLTDAANSIEWKQKVTPRMLDLVVHLVSNPETNVSNLSDHSVAVIISSAGSLCRSLPPAVRSKKLKKITENLSKRGAKLGVEARNALLNAEIDNGVVVNVVKALEEYSLSDCDPDIQTYTALARAYARRGNVRGIFEIIEYVKQNGMAVNQSLFESLVSSLSLSNEDDKAMNIIQEAFPLVFCDSLGTSRSLFPSIRRLSILLHGQPNELST